MQCRYDAGKDKSVSSQTVLESRLKCTLIYVMSPDVSRY